jgi:hypothetical protein
VDWNPLTGQQKTKKRKNGKEKEVIPNLHPSATAGHLDAGHPAAGHQPPPP